MIYTDIYKAAFNSTSPKANRARAFAILRASVGDFDNRKHPATLADFNGRYELTEDQMRDLLSHFRTPIPRKARTPFEWVGKAICKDNYRDYLNQCWWDADQKCLYATDGFRGHAERILDYEAPSGYHTYEGIAIDKQGEFPTLEKFMHGDSEVSGTFKLDQCAIEVGRRTEDKYLKIGECWFKEKHVLDMLNGESGAKFCTTEKPGSHLFTFADHPARRAVLMPVRGDMRY